MQFLTRRVSAIGLLAIALPLAVAGAQTAPAPISGILVDPKGNVGIGTENPQDTLHVNGNLIVEGVAAGSKQTPSWLLQRAPQSGQFVFRGQSLGTLQPEFFLSINPKDDHKPLASEIQINVQIPLVDEDMGIVDDKRQILYSHVAKTFVIDHPGKPGRYLMHAALEGPEAGVYYRGTAKLQHGRAVIRLPDYFEQLTRQEGRTVQITNVDGFDILAVQTQEGRTIANGTIIVASRNRRSNQSFDWAVYALRSDVAELTVEPLKSEVSVLGVGPYTYALPKARSAERASEATKGSGQ